MRARAMGIGVAFVAIALSAAPSDGGALAASLPRAPAAADSDPIAMIRARYEQIQAGLPRYRRTEHELPGYSPQGAALEGYFAGDELRKMRARFYGEGGRALVEYYLWKHELIFVFRQEERYERPLSAQGPGAAAGHVVSRTESRFYFVGGRLYRWVDSTGRPRPLDTQAAREWDGTLGDDARIFSLCAAAAANDTTYCRAPVE
jgi:hypothetical protein